MKIVDFMNMFSQGEHPILYEVIDGHFITNVYFDIDKACDGAPSSAECTRALNSALDFLRTILGDTQFAVSEAHRSGKISFHIVCPKLTATRTTIKKIAKLAGGKDLGIDTAVYNAGRQLMRPVCSRGEKGPDVPALHPVPGYVGVFSDHIIQAIKIGSTRLNEAAIPTPGPIPYVSSHGLVEDLIAAIDFKKLCRFDRQSLISRLKVENLRSLFDYKMKQIGEFEGGSLQSKLDSAWVGYTGYAPFPLNVIARVLDIDGKTNCNDVIAERGLQWSGGQLWTADRVPVADVMGQHNPEAQSRLQRAGTILRLPVPWVATAAPEPPVTTVEPTPQVVTATAETLAPAAVPVSTLTLSDEDKAIIIKLLAEKIATLSRIQLCVQQSS